MHYGLRQEQWERFTVGIDYDAFFVTRKNELKTNFRPKLAKVDKSLDKYLGMKLFKKKVDDANETLKKYGLPKIDKE